MTRFFLKLTLAAITTAAVLIACDKNRDNGKEKNCNHELELYNNAKEIATADSVAFMGWKETAPILVQNNVNKNIREGMTEEEAWEVAINNAITNPNAPEEIKEWALKYQELLDAFNASIATRNSAYDAWQQCEAGD